MERVICSATTKAGNPCRSPSMEGMAVCPAHHPDPLVRAEYARQNSLRGQARMREIREEADGEPRSLRSVDDLLAALERALASVEASGGDKIKKSSAVAKLVSTAHEIMKGDVERNAKRLAEIVEQYPELAKRVAEVKALE